MKSNAARNQQIYLGDELLDRVDAHRRELQEHSPGLKVTTSAAVRNLLLRALGDGGDASGDGQSR